MAFCQGGIGAGFVSIVSKRRKGKDGAFEMSSRRKPQRTPKVKRTTKAKGTIKAKRTTKAKRKDETKIDLVYQATFTTQVRHDVQRERYQKALHLAHVAWTLFQRPVFRAGRSVRGQL